MPTKAIWWLVIRQKLGSPLKCDGKGISPLYNLYWLSLQRARMLPWMTSLMRFVKVIVISESTLYHLQIQVVKIIDGRWQIVYKDHDQEKQRTQNAPLGNTRDYR